MKHFLVQDVCCGCLFAHCSHRLAYFGGHFSRAHLRSLRDIPVAYGFVVDLSSVGIRLMVSSVCNLLECSGRERLLHPQPPRAGEKPRASGRKREGWECRFEPAPGNYLPEE